MNFKQAQPTWLENATPRGTNVVQFRRISTEEMASDLKMDVRVINDRMRDYRRDLNALRRLRRTKREQLEICMSALGRQS